MADTKLTADAEATELTQAQVPGTFWEVMRDVEQNMRAAWIAGSATVPDKPRARRLLSVAMLQMERARELMS